MFSELDIKDPYHKKILMEKIELIDYPGLDIKDEFYQEIVFSPLMQFSDWFIFVNNCDLIEERGNTDILKTIVNEIISMNENRLKKFSYKSCLFILNKSDKSSSNLNIEKSNKLFEKIFFNNNKQNNDDLNVNKF